MNRNAGHTSNANGPHFAFSKTQNSEYDDTFHMDNNELQHQHDNTAQTFGNAKAPTNRPMALGASAEDMAFFATQKAPLKTTDQFYNSLGAMQRPAANPLLNLDLSKSNFGHAINFEMMQQQNPRMQEAGGGDMSFDGDEESMPRGANTSHRGMASNLDASFDLLEQQQAVEQARLVERFRQLHQWQYAQQQQLVLQQERELKQLQENTHKVHSLISHKRHLQWGGGRPGVHVLNQSVGDSVRMVTPPRRSRPHSTIPQALARGAFAHAKNSVLNDTEETINRPMPDFNNIASTFLPSSRSGEVIESELASDSGTLSTGGIMRAEGVYPLPDTASESSERTPLPHQHLLIKRQPHLSHAAHRMDAPRDTTASLYFESSRIETDRLSPNVHNQNEQISPRFSKHDTHIDLNKVAAMNKHGRWNQGATDYEVMDLNRVAVKKNGNWNVVANPEISNGPDAEWNESDDEVDLQKDLSYEQYPLTENAIPEDNEDISSLNFSQSQVRVKVPQVTHLETSFRSDRVDRSEIETQMQRVCSAETDSGVYAETVTSKDDDMRSTVMTHAAQSDEQNNRAMPVQNEASPLQKNPNTEDVETRGTYDDIPVKGFTGNKKTFEELLEEELQKEELRLQTTGADVTDKNPKRPPLPSKKTFLRKGVGVSRYGVQQKTITSGRKRENKSEKVKTEESKETLKVETPPQGPKKTDPDKVNKKLLSKLTLRRKTSPKKAQPSTSKDESSPANTTIENSFCNLLEERKQIEVQENEELQEFEILEKFADDNASFTSNCSFVKKVISSHNIVKDFPECSKQILKPQDSVSKTDQRGCEDDVMKRGGDLVVSSDSEDEATSNSDLDDTDSGDDTMVDETLVSQTNQNDQESVQSKPTTQSPVYHNQRPTAVITNRKTVEKSPVTTERACHAGSEAAQIPDSEKKDEARDRERSDSEAQTESEQEEEALSDSDKENQCVGQKGHLHDNGMKKALDFDDDFSWGEADEDDDESDEEEDFVLTIKPAAVQTAGRRPVILKEKVSVSSTRPEATDPPHSGQFSTPPTSQLVTKLFPKLEPVKPKPTAQQQIQKQKLEQASQNEIKDGIVSTAMREKLLQLENEIEKFRNENIVLAKLRSEREQGLSKLQKEIEEFGKQKSDELTRLKEFKEQEMKKIKKERKLFEQHQKSVRAIPDKKDRELIETLKAQLSDLQEEFKRKENRMNASANRLRDRISQLESENKELKSEVKLLEKKRLESWQKQQSKVEEVAKNKSPTSQMHKETSAKTNAPKTDRLSPSQANTKKSPQISVPAVEAFPTNLKHIPDKQQADIQRDKSEDSTIEAPVHEKQLPRKPSSKMNREVHDISLDDENYDEIQHADGKLERIYKNGAREILFANGTRKQIGAGGQAITVSFFNGDIKQIMPDQRVVYYYADTQITNTTYPDGLEIIQFPNNQLEKHYPDGTREITFPDQTIKYLFPNGSEESIFPDGTVIRVEKNGHKVMEFPNGQREIHSDQFKKREYPDGTVKTVYPDGRQETRYSTGRIRVKDKDGNILVDRHEPRS